MQPLNWHQPVPLQPHSRVLPEPRQSPCCPTDPACISSLPKPAAMPYLSSPTLTKHVPFPPPRPSPRQTGGDALFVRPCASCPTRVSTVAFYMGDKSIGAFTTPTQKVAYTVTALGTAAGGVVWAQVRGRVPVGGFECAAKAVGWQRNACSQQRAARAAACSRLLAAAGWLLRLVVLLWMWLLWSERTGFACLERAAV